MFDPKAVMPVLRLTPSKTSRSSSGRCSCSAPPNQARLVSICCDRVSDWITWRRSIWITQLGSGAFVSLTT